MWRPGTSAPRARPRSHSDRVEPDVQFGSIPPLASVAIVARPADQSVNPVGVGEPLIVAPRPDQDLRRLHRRRPRRLRRAPGRGVRLPRPERRRQELDDADDRLRRAGHVRVAAHPRHGPDDPGPADPRAARRRAAAGHPRHRAAGARQPLHLRPLLRPVARASWARRSTSCSSSPSSPTARSRRSSRCPAA